MNTRMRSFVIPLGIIIVVFSIPAIGIVMVRNRVQTPPLLFDLAAMRHQAEITANVRETKAQAIAQREEAKAKAKNRQQRAEGERRHKKSLADYRAKFSDEEWKIHESLAKRGWKKKEEAIREFAQAVTYLLGFAYEVRSVNNSFTYNDEQKGMESWVEFHIETILPFYSEAYQSIEKTSVVIDVEIHFIIRGKNDIVCNDVVIRHEPWNVPKGMELPEIAVSEATREECVKLFSKVIDLITAPPS